MKHPSLRYALMLCSIAFVLLTPLIFFGLDYTDTGYSTSMAWLQAVHPHAALWDFNNFGSAFLAGFWFYTGADSLLAYRLQWELMIIGTAICAYVLLALFYNDHKAIALALIPTLILAVFNSEEGLVAEYHNLPPFLCLVSATFFLRCFATEKPFSARTALLCFGSGVVAAFMIFARLPMILWCGVVYGLFAFAWWRGVMQGSHAWQLSLWYSIGIVAGGAVCIGLLYARGFTLSGIIESSITSIRAVNTFHAYAAHHPELGYYPLLKSTAIRYTKILSVGAFAFALALVWQKTPLMKTRAGRIIELLLLCGFALGIIAIVLVLADKSLGFHYGPVTSFLLGAPLLIIAYIAVTSFRESRIESNAGAIEALRTGQDIASSSAEEDYRNTTHRQVLYLAAGAFFVLASLGGSGVWVSNFRHGVWLVLPIVLLESHRLASQWFDFAIVRKFLVVGAITLGIALRIQMPYRDQPTYRLHSWFSSPALRGIASSEGRTQTLEELLHECTRRGIQANDTIQAYPSLAMLYFITKTIPWYKHPWIGQMWTVRQDLVRHQESCTFPAGFPRYVVRGKFDPNTAVSLDAGRPSYTLEVGYMPEKFFYGEYKYCHDCTTYLDSLFLVHQGYKVVWENQGFALLERP